MSYNFVIVNFFGICLLSYEFLNFFLDTFLVVEVRVVLVETIDCRSAAWVMVISYESSSRVISRISRLNIKELPLLTNRSSPGWFKGTENRDNVNMVNLLQYNYAQSIGTSIPY